MLALATYSALMPMIMRKKGRQVDVRVLSCEPKVLEIQGVPNKATYYSVTVDFFGQNGETIVKSVNSEKPYNVGDAVRYIYG